MIRGPVDPSLLLLFRPIQLLVTRAGSREIPIIVPLLLTLRLEPRSRLLFRNKAVRKPRTRTVVGMIREPAFIVFRTIALTGWRQRQRTLIVLNVALKNRVRFAITLTLPRKLRVKFRRHLIMIHGRLWLTGSPTIFPRLALLISRGGRPPSRVTVSGTPFNRDCRLATGRLKIHRQMIPKQSIFPRSPAFKSRGPMFAKRPKLTETTQHRQLPRLPSTV